MTAADFQKFLNHQVLLPTKQTQSRRAFLRNCQVEPPISNKSVLRCLDKLGFKYTSVFKTGYSDGRYRDDVQKYKVQYCQLMKSLQTYMPVWTHLPLAAFEKKFPKEKPDHWVVGDGLVEFSVDFLSEEEVSACNYRFGGDWSPRSQIGVQELKVKPGEKILLFSQDDCVLNTNDDKSLGWRKDGLNNHRRKKSEGQGVMVSGFLPEFCKFLTFSEEEVMHLGEMYQDKFTCTRSLSKLLDIKKFAGASIAIHQYGKNFGGYWNNEKMMQHVKDFLRCVKYPFRQDNVRILILFDWSSGHAAMADNALVASRMGWRFGGKQPIMHDAKVRDLYPNANDPALRQLGSRQSMVFREGEKPFYKSESNADFTGVQKGMMQVLWERSLLTPEMSLKGKLSSEGNLRVETL